jgi:hypothetical protein
VKAAAAFSIVNNLPTAESFAFQLLFKNIKVNIWNYNFACCSAFV